jgi:hypothetical protein
MNVKSPRLPEPPITRPCPTHRWDYDPQCSTCDDAMFSVIEQPVTVAVYRPTGRVYVREEVTP